MEPELKAIAEAQLRTEITIGKLVKAQLRTHDLISQLSVTVNRYVDAADARMKRTKENLDGLIRAISREHSNGKQ